MPGPIHVLIVDDQPLLLDALEGLLRKHEFEVVGKATSASEALGLLSSLEVDVVLLDVTIPGLDRLAFIREVRRSHPGASVIVVSGSADKAEIASVLESGAAAYVRRDADPSDLVTAVRQAVRQSVFFQNDAGSRAAVPPPRSTVDLTPRELEILQLVAEGGSNAEIARRLWVTEQTVKFHLSNIYRKLGVSNRTEASRYAHLHGLLGRENGVAEA